MLLLDTRIQLALSRMATRTHMWPTDPCCRPPHPSTATDPLSTPHGTYAKPSLMQHLVKLNAERGRRDHPCPLEGPAAERPTTRAVGQRMEHWAAVRGAHRRPILTLERPRERSRSRRACRTPVQPCSTICPLYSSRLVGKARPLPVARCPTWRAWRCASPQPSASPRGRRSPAPRSAPPASTADPQSRLLLCRSRRRG